MFGLHLKLCEIVVLFICMTNINTNTVFVYIVHTFIYHFSRTSDHFVM